MSEANWEIDIKKRNVCATCKHWRRMPTVNADEDTISLGDCHRFPPQIAIDAGGEVVVHFPWTTESDACGEYARF